ncbi:unnamed protein product [Closterium sp. NIES-64]|nr:unnamed protein product [Closterium sp. NIES-64]
MEWLTSAEGLNARQELDASICEHHPNLRDEEVDLIVDGRLLRMVRERAAEQALASGQQGGTSEGGAAHVAPGAVGIDGGAVVPTIDTGMIGTSYGQFMFGVEHISVTPLLEGKHDLIAWTQLAQLKKGDDETTESYCNRARTIRAELLTIGQEVHMATFAAHVLKGLPPKYGFLRRKLKISSPDMTVERVCSEVLMEEQTLSIEQSYKQITNDASVFSSAVNTIVATTGVNGKEGKGGREQTDKKKDGKREKKRAPFKGRCYNCNEEGHMAAKCPNKKKDTTHWTATNSGMLGMDLEKGGEDTSSVSSQEAKLTRQTLLLPDEREGKVLGMVHGPESNKGMPPVRLPASTMTASDAVDGNNMYGIAFLARGVYGTDIYYDVEYLDEADVEEGGLRSIIINLGVTLTGPEGKLVDKDFLMVEYMSSTEGYLGLQIVRDHPNKTLLLHQNAYVAKVQQRFFKGAPPKKQPITPLSSTSFVMEDAAVCRSHHDRPPCALA